jgi:hypothetical protein
MDTRAILIGLLVTTAAITLTWFGRLPFQFVAVAGLGPIVAGFMSRSTDSKAFEGVAAIGGGYLLAIPVLAIGRYLLFPELSFRWQIDVAVTTMLFATIGAIFAIPVSCIAGAALGGVGAFLRDVVDGGPSL